MNEQHVKECIQACLKCLEACNTCFDQCLQEADVK
ncbi:four-helix bundle copper-binding protein [Domibacillus tundrae]|nr:four-helix bundle copper-binding protein [Domibacillus tundrae]